MLFIIIINKMHNQYILGTIGFLINILNHLKMQRNGNVIHPV